ncbi:MAG: DUF1616 domain-containing protein [Candidatus Bathyarchaeia archaeon]|jgi:predicted RNA-binding protein YlxR (DUF448 family)
MCALNIQKKTANQETKTTRIEYPILFLVTVVIRIISIIITPQNKKRGRLIKVTKNLNQATKEQIKDLIIQTIKQEKTTTAKQLIALMQEHHAIPPEQTTTLLIELENENRLHFTKQKPPIPASTKEYIFSKQAAWYWTTIALVGVTMIAVFAIPESDVPLVYLRSALGVVFVLFLPGFAFIKALFPAKVPVKTSSEDMDTIVRLVLSIGMNLAFSPIVVLILNYTPWGIRLTPITLSLLALTVIFATAAILREHQTRPTQT